MSKKKVQSRRDDLSRRQLLATAVAVTAGGIISGGDSVSRGETLQEGKEMPCVDAPVSHDVEKFTLGFDARELLTDGPEPPAAYAAAQALPETIPADVARSAPSLDGEPTIEAQLAAWKHWDSRVLGDRRELRVAFVNNGAEVASMKPLVQDLVTKNWEPHIGLKFNFGDTVTLQNADIRVRFQSSDGHWSAVGTDALDRPKSIPTMNIGADTLAKLETPYLRGVVLHEFGHALGCVHEHQSPASRIEFDPVAVSRYFKGKHGWSDKMVKYNILDRYEATTLKHFSEFDPLSIMIYMILPEWTRGGTGTKVNNVLSELDIEFIRKLYIPDVPLPKPATEPERPTVQKLSLDGTAVPGSIGKIKESEFDLTTTSAGDVTIWTEGQTQATVTVQSSGGTAMTADKSMTPDLVNEAKYFKSLPSGTYRVKVSHFRGVDRGDLAFTVRAKGGDQTRLMIDSSKR